jgi:hypothetical protein
LKFKKIHLKIKKYGVIKKWPDVFNNQLFFTL